METELYILISKYIEKLENAVEICEENPHGHLDYEQIKKTLKLAKQFRNSLTKLINE